MSDAQPFPIPTLTKNWHTRSYASIDPKRPELSMEGKTAIITGAGSGIGRHTAAAFAAAGAANVILFGGRRENLLSETVKDLHKEYSGTEVSFIAVDMANRAAIKEAATKIGGWDILVLNAAHLPDVGLITDTDLDDWAKAWDVNLSGNFQIIQSLLPKRKSNATIIGTSSGAIDVGPDLVGTQVPYVVSKIGLSKAFELFAGTYTDCHWVTFHPGAVATDMFVKGRMSEKGLMANDDASLPAHFAVWLASAESRFLQGRYVWCNWDVEEMVAMADDIRKGLMLTTGTMGWPFGFEPATA